MTYSSAPDIPAERQPELRAKHLVIVQFGDYEEGFERLNGGGRENYYAQRYTVDCVGLLAKKIQRVTVVTFSGNRAPKVLANGVHTVGLELFPSGLRPRYQELVHVVADLGPDRLVVISPILSLLRWARSNSVPTLPMFMDSFRSRRIRARVENWLLGRLLRSNHFQWVANHGISAAEDLVRIGVPASKTLAFDWPALDDPSRRSRKQLDINRIFRLIYVGQISSPKGVWDLIQAVDELNSRGPRKYSLTLYGKDQGEQLAKKVATGLARPDAIHFPGLIPHDAVIDAMHDHDAVVVCSRHEYPEGIPMTIFESFCSRTPLIASDHPMFDKKLRHDQNCVKFKASSVPDLANAIIRLSTDSEIYAKLSEATATAAESHLLPLKYHMLLESWAEDPVGSVKSLTQYTLASIRI